MLKCLGEPLGPSASPVRGPEACWVTDVMVRAPNLGAAGKQPCVPFPSPRCWAGGRSFTLVPSWELEGELSSTLWLPALLSKEAVSGLEAKLCCCPRPALLQPRSPSAPEAALGSGWCWDFPPCSCAGGQCSGRGGAAACLPLHLPSLTCCGCPLGGQQRGMAVQQKVQHGGTLWEGTWGGLWPPAPGAQAGPRVLAAAHVLCPRKPGVLTGQARAAEPASQPLSPAVPAGTQHPCPCGCQSWPSAPVWVPAPCSAVATGLTAHGSGCELSSRAECRLLLLQRLLFVILVGGSRGAAGADPGEGCTHSNGSLQAAAHPRLPQ